MGRGDGEALGRCRASGEGLSRAQAASVQDEYLNTFTTGLGTPVCPNIDLLRVHEERIIPYSQATCNPAGETGGRFTARGNQHLGLCWPVHLCVTAGCYLPGAGEEMWNDLPLGVRRLQGE